MLDVLRLTKGIDFFRKSSIIIIVEGRDNTLKGLGLRTGTGTNPQKLESEKKSRKKYKNPLTKSPLSDIIKM